MGVDTSKWKSTQNFNKNENALIEKIASQEPKKYLPNEVQYKKYESQPYNTFTNAINVHSWFPFYYFRSGSNFTGYSAMPGLTLLSQNLQSTLVAEAKNWISVWTQLFRIILYLQRLVSCISGKYVLSRFVKEFKIHYK